MSGRPAGLGRCRHSNQQPQRQLRGTNGRARWHCPALTSMKPGDFVVATRRLRRWQDHAAVLHCRLHAAVGGRILLGGQPVYGPGAERGVVFQKHALMPWLSVRGERRIRPAHARHGEGRASCHRDGQTAARATRKVCRLPDLSDLRRHAAAHGVAGAGERSCAVMLMDEPLGALDVDPRAHSGPDRQPLVADEEDVFFITHSVEEALFGPPADRDDAVARAHLRTAFNRLSRSSSSTVRIRGR